MADTSLRARRVVTPHGIVGPAAVESALARSITTWNQAAIGCSDLRLVDDGYPTGLTTNLTGGRPDMDNRIVWREDDWPAEVSGATLALTTLVYRRSTGEIEDADIDLNGFNHTFTDTDDPALVNTDVENTLTHELGHLIGLFLGNTARLIADVEEGAAAGDADRVRRAVHTLKSSSANLGATTLSKLCAELERFARDGQVEETAKRLDVLHFELDGVIAALRALRPGAAA